MIKLTINDKKYKVKTKWDEVKIKELQPYEMPLSLKYAYEKKETVNDKDLKKTLPEFYRQMIAMFSDIPTKVLDKMPYDAITTIYYSTIEKLVYELTMLSFDGKPKHMLKSKYFVEDEIPAYDMTAYQFCEANDVASNIKNDPKLIGLLPLVYQRNFTELKALNKYPKMLNKKVSDVLPVFFFMSKLCSMFRRYIMMRSVLARLQNYQRSGQKVCYLN